MNNKRNEEYIKNLSDMIERADDIDLPKMAEACFTMAISIINAIMQNASDDKFAKAKELVADDLRKGMDAGRAAMLARIKPHGRA